MITRLEIDGFKSLRDFAVDLEPFTVFIGPNSAGKSNILEALALLSRLASQPIADAFKHGRGRPSDQFSHNGDDSVRIIRFAVEFLDYGYFRPDVGCIPGAQSRCRYELTIARESLASGAERLLVRDERFAAIHSERDTWIANHPEFADVSTYGRAGAQVYDALAQSGTSLHIGLMQWTPAEAKPCRQNLAMISALRLDGARLGEPSDPIDSDSLNADGSNLPSILAGLPPVLLGEIRADLVRLVPGIASFDVIPDNDELRLEFHLSGGQKMPARLVSDGTLRVLGLLTALRLDPRPYLLTVEEPENGIYPGRLRALLRLLQEETARRHDGPDDVERMNEMLRDGGSIGIFSNLLPTQILVTTHSPVLLSALHKQPQHLRFVDTVRRDGRPVTRVRTVGRPATPAEGRFKISPREIEQLLDSTRDEETE